MGYEQIILFMDLILHADSTYIMIMALIVLLVLMVLQSFLMKNRYQIQSGADQDRILNKGRENQDGDRFIEECLITSPELKICSLCRAHLDPKKFFKFTDINCGQQFHAKCILPWLKRFQDCPLCRQLIWTMPLFRLGIRLESEDIKTNNKGVMRKRTYLLPFNVDVSRLLNEEKEEGEIEVLQGFAYLSYPLQELHILIQTCGRVIIWSRSRVNYIKLLLRIYYEFAPKQ